MQVQVTHRIVALSDTHSSFSQFESLLSKNISGDFFIFAGDFTRYGREQQFRQFIDYMSRLQFRHKIVIAGNHQISLDSAINPAVKAKIKEQYPCKMSRQQILTQLQSVSIYLEHQMVEIEGLKIFGSPYTQKYSKGAFQYAAKDEQITWNSLPHQIDILITHSPPFGILDKTSKEKHVGSITLRSRVSQIKPKLHIFGHIHQAHGVMKLEGTTFMNVAKKYKVFQLQC